MSHMINTVILLLLYQYIGLWYKKRPPTFPLRGRPRHSRRPFIPAPRWLLSSPSYERIGICDFERERMHSRLFFVHLPFGTRTEKARLTQSIEVYRSLVYSVWSVSHVFEKQKGFLGKKSGWPYWLSEAFQEVCIFHADFLLHSITSDLVEIYPQERVLRTQYCQMPYLCERIG